MSTLDCRRPAEAAYARTGRRREAEMVLDAALHRAGKPSNAAIAIIYTGMDDKEHALDWLEKAYQERDTIMTHLKVDPLFDIAITSAVSGTDTLDAFGLGCFYSHDSERQTNHIP